MMSGLTLNNTPILINEAKQMTNTKDIKYINIQYLASTGKQPLKITLVDTITRGEAVDLISLIDNGSNKEVFRVTAWTTSNTYI